MSSRGVWMKSDSTFSTSFALTEKSIVTPAFRTLLAAHRISSLRHDDETHVRTSLAFRVTHQWTIRWRSLICCCEITFITTWWNRQTSCKQKLSWKIQPQAINLQDSDIIRVELKEYNSIIQALTAIYKKLSARLHKTLLEDLGSR